MEWTTTSQDFTIHHFKYSLTIMSLHGEDQTQKGRSIVFEMMNCEILAHSGPLHYYTPGRGKIVPRNII